MNTRIINDGKVLLYSGLDPEKLERYSFSADLSFVPNVKDWEGTTLYVLDWKLSDGNVTITYQLRNDPYAGIHDLTAPVVKDSYPLQKPSRSKHWEFNRLSEQWVNRRTGEKVYVI